MLHKPGVPIGVENIGGGGGGGGLSQYIQEASGA